MTMHISYIPKKDCWNPYDTYGMICVHCGCCSDDVIARQKARLELARRRLQEELNFDQWDDEQNMRAIQEKVVKSNIRYWRRRVRYYETALRRADDAR